MEGKKPSPTEQGYNIQTMPLQIMNIMLGSQAIDCQVDADIGRRLLTPFVEERVCPLWLANESITPFVRQVVCASRLVFAMRTSPILGDGSSHSTLLSPSQLGMAMEGEPYSTLIPQEVIPNHPNGSSWEGVQLSLRLGHGITWGRVGKVCVWDIKELMEATFGKALRCLLHLATLFE